jgi:multiple sugar transport system permease protein
MAMKKDNPLFKAGIYTLLIIWCTYSIMPFLWTLLTSFKYPVEANNPRVRIWGFTPTMDNYAQLWLKTKNGTFLPYALGILAVMLLLVIFYRISKSTKMSPRITALIITTVIVAVAMILPNVVRMAKFYNYFINSLIVTMATLIISISIGCLGGYALARYRKIWGVVILIAALGFRALPRMAFVLPYFFLGQAVHLYDTLFLVVITLVAVNQPFTIWMLKSFFQEIPKEMEEAAMIDGAGRLETFLKIIIPISWPGIITTSLFTLTLAYNEFLLVRILTQANWTLPVAIASYTSGEDAAYRTIAAAASVSITIPLLFVIMFFQKYLVKGLSAGAVKG